VKPVALLIYGPSLVLTLFWVAALIDAGRTDIPDYTRAKANKGMTMLLLLIAGCLGAAYWFGMLRPRIRRAQLPTAARSKRS
jgi:hypothetical protein